MKCVAVICATNSWRFSNWKSRGKCSGETKEETSLKKHQNTAMTIIRLLVDVSGLQRKQRKMSCSTK
ncbi:hypothetical protein M378DRAFT_648256 [Amanita muscaria Koide BX008]|uniref:Uncharacterized protein n=1 Tax=Amanita muscaria (strain Koide BX008) TaxID=946122 RepID=A0A0C2X3X9_AMAMK|nr:hypothetical protein M378DRAFT_648256 [Amanita muscaria Koide BX008]